MKRIIGFLAFTLGSVGLVACLAGLIAIWVVRPSALRSSAEALEAADDGLKLVDEKAKTANDLVGKFREVLDPITSKIIRLADKAERTPEDEKELKRIQEELAQRLDQVDTIAEVAGTAISLLNRTSRLTRSVRGAADQSAADDSRDASDALSRLPDKLKTLRTSLAKFREDKQVQKEVVDSVVRLAGDVDKELKQVDSKLQRVRQKSAEFEAEVTELRAAVPGWVNWAAIIGSVILAWMGAGQLALLRCGWARLRAC